MSAQKRPDAAEGSVRSERIVSESRDDGAFQAEKAVRQRKIPTAFSARGRHGYFGGDDGGPPGKDADAVRQNDGLVYVVGDEKRRQAKLPAVARYHSCMADFVMASRAENGSSRSTAPSEAR